MLKDRVAEKKNEQEDRSGYCKFCGKQTVVKALKEFTDEELDELVTENCDCVDAEYYSLQKKRREKAHREIDNLFGNENTPIMDDEQLKMLHGTVEPVLNGEVSSVAINISRGLKMSIKVTSKGAIKIERADSDKNSAEI